MYGGFTTPILASAMLSFGAALLAISPVMKKPFAGSKDLLSDG
jgi:hypothetical protein